MASHLRNITLLDPDSGMTRGVDLVTDTQGRIARIGPDLPPAPGVPVIDAQGALCLPGFVNSHNHSPLMIVRGMIEDISFAPAYTPGVPQGHWLSDEETLALARLGVMEMLCAGATTIVDYYRCPEALAQAAAEFGLRAQVGGRVMDMDSAALAEGRFARDDALGEATLGAALALRDKWAGHARISTILAPHAPDSCSREMFAQMRDLATASDTQVHTHLSQSQMEVDQIRAREGMTPTEFLDDLGLLTPDLIAAHCIFMTDSDVARFGAAGAVVAHAPIGNASFGAAAPIKALAEAGARITLCTDTKSADMFEAMRMALASAVRALGINLVMTPVYLALLFTAIGPAIAFFLVNGWLLGRDLGDMVASRHMDDATMRGWRKATRGQRFVLGLAVAGLFVVPLANLFAPILGAAMATHLFHGGRGGHA